MPLYCGEPFVSQPVPDNLDSNDCVFYYKLTGEIFTNHDDYFERTILCSSLVWTCSITGKSHLTFQEALESEAQARLLQQTFHTSNYDQHQGKKEKDTDRRGGEKLAPMLTDLMHYISFTSARDICDMIYVFAGNRYFSGEIVDILISNIKFRAQITRVISPHAQCNPSNAANSSIQMISPQSTTSGGATSGVPSSSILEHRRSSCHDEFNLPALNNNNNNMIIAPSSSGQNNSSTILEDQQQQSSSFSCAFNSSLLQASSSGRGLHNAATAAFSVGHNCNNASHQYKYEVEPLGDKKLELVKYLKSYQALIDVLPPTTARAGSVKVTGTCANKYKLDHNYRNHHNHHHHYNQQFVQKLTHVIVDACYVARPSGSLLQLPVRYIMRRRLRNHRSIVEKTHSTTLISQSFDSAPYSESKACNSSSHHTKKSQSIDENRCQSFEKSLRISREFNPMHVQLLHMHVLTEKASALNDKSAKSNDLTFGQIVNLVTNTYDRIELPMAIELANIVPGTRMDELARVLVTSFDARRLLKPLLHSMFNKEIQEVADCMQTLFRGNSLATRVMSYCFKIFGSNYLKELLEPHIKPLISPLASHQSSGEVGQATIAVAAATVPAAAAVAATTAAASDTYIKNNNSDDTNSSCEIDPSRLEPGTDIERNRRNLQSFTKQVFDSIVASASQFPPQLRTMCNCLYQVLNEHYSKHDQRQQGDCNRSKKSSLVAISTVIFLRFINPAIVSPCELGIIDRQPDAKVKRKLMLVSKILQNIANNVEFRKEDHMVPFNDFLREHFEPVRQLVAQLVEPPANENHFISSHPTNPFFGNNATVLALYRCLLGGSQCTMTQATPPPKPPPPKMGSVIKINYKDINKTTDETQEQLLTQYKNNKNKNDNKNQQLDVTKQIDSHSNQLIDDISHNEHDYVGTKSTRYQKRSQLNQQQQTTHDNNIEKQNQLAMLSNVTKCHNAQSQPPKRPPNPNLNAEKVNKQELINQKSVRPQLTLPKAQTNMPSTQNTLNSNNGRANTPPGTPSRRTPAVRRMNAVLCCAVS